MNLKRTRSSRLIPGDRLMMYSDTEVRSVTTDKVYWYVRDYFNLGGGHVLQDMDCLVVSSGERPMVLVSYSGASRLFYVIDTFVSLICSSLPPEGFLP